MRNKIEHCIKGDLKPFSIHEVGIYDNASYYLPKNKITSPKYTKEITKAKNKRNKKEIEK